jgi:hypothetical protein
MCMGVSPPCWDRCVLCDGASSLPRARRQGYWRKGSDGWGSGLHISPLRRVPSVGSIPLPDAETVFRPLAAATGPHLKRLPDGETGIRKTSIRFLQQVLARNGRSACALALRSSRPSPLNRHSPDSRQLRESRVALLTGLGNANRPPRKAIPFLPELEDAMGRAARTWQLRRCK